MAFAYYSYRFTPPVVDDSLREWLYRIDRQALKEYLRNRNRVEWENAWHEARYLVFWNLGALVLVIVLVAAGAKGIWETFAIALSVGLLLSILSAILSVTSLCESHVRRWLWYKKTKATVDKDFCRTLAIRSLKLD